MKSVHLPGAHRILKDRKFGNQVYFVHLDPKDSKKLVELIFHTIRIEKNAFPDSPDHARKYLEPDRLTPVNENFKQIASDIIKGKKETLVQARALYDHVIDRMKYIRYGNGWGKGDAVYACNVKTGNCTDFHSYFIALARSIGIPARFSMGFSIPSERDDGGIQGYHCWAEFYAEGQWWPVDISEADKYSALSSYYFGRHPANRIEFSRGRDIVLKPGPRSGPINFLVYPILEIGENPVEIKAQFSFLRYLPDDITREDSSKKTF
jgi:transglutaminase-like putative cysteine protease